MDSRQLAHRITMRFTQGDLHADMLAWLDGQPLTDTLKREVLAYRYCKLDDTWAEACHRDVSREGKRNTRASQAWVSASLRLQQNLDVFSMLDSDMLKRADMMLLRWKSIGQTIPRRAIALKRRKVPASAVLQFVYRCGVHSLDN